jgi:hypothetical protein
LKVKVGGELKQQVQFRFGHREPLGMISLHYWTGGYSIPVCGSSWVTDASCEQQVGGVLQHYLQTGLT